MGLEVEFRVREIEENYPAELEGRNISDYLAQLKAMAFKNTLSPDEILITADTVVWYKNKALGKPIDEREAISMLMSLSGDWHEVITSVCFTSPKDHKPYYQGKVSGVDGWGNTILCRDIPTL